jgi:NAD(P)-dependent dehydrogenase (short-subunit alcohol dehydrogenase family)
MSVSSSTSSLSPFKSRAVLVTGAAQRIGRGLALGFAAHGWDVAVHFGGSELGAQEVVEAIRALGRNAIALRADLAIEDEVLRLVPQCRERLGGLACVVNCASRFDEDTARDFGYAKLLEMTAINLAAPVTLARALFETIPDAAIDDETQRGCVINVLDQKLYNMNPDYL